MKKTFILVGLMLSITVASAVQKARSSKGLQAGPVALSPMEARIERASGNADATSTRIENAKRASRQLGNAVEGSQPIPNGQRVRYKRVKKCGCGGSGSSTTPTCPSTSSGENSSVRRSPSCGGRKGCRKAP